ncbi:MAG: MerR family transcriptional regulator [Agathobacter sp.]|nr:MerR family transcriptional regulator [Agathobacter sp.]
MTIKDVEKLTGLTAKSIRYYEDKGLLTVERNEENDYRSYSEAEVNRLKRIKLFRYLEFSVEEVKAMLDMDAKEIEKVLEQKAESFSNLRDRCLDKQELCHCLAKDYKKDEEKLNQIISDYNQAVVNIESEELAEIEEELKYLGAPSLSVTILQTLIFLGPILWLFISISEGMIENLMFLAGTSIFGTAWITGIWIFYFVQRSRNKTRVKKKNKAHIWIFPMMILALVLGLACFIGVDTLVQGLLIPEDFLFYNYPYWAQRGMITIVILTIFFIGCLLISKISTERKKQMELDNGLISVWNKLGKGKIIVAVVWFLASYCCVTNFTVVTEDAIICHSPIRPLGISYEYSDVEEITTGVGQKDVTFFQHERKGQFYYQIELDGKTITFLTGSSTNDKIERYNEHTYLWFEEFDQKLVEIGIPKEGDATGCEHISMDQEYVDRFVRIIENK